jgi:type IV secretory pathway TraG/TraD family ATPase VirD4
LKNWPNEHRSKGLCIVAGVQNKTQLEGTYGETEARTIIGAFGTRIYMNPTDIDTADWISRGLPEKEVVLKSRSRSFSAGRGTTNYSEEVRSVPLMKGAQINQMQTGEAIIINPHFCAHQSGFIPIHRHIRLSKRYQELNTWCENNWSAHLRPSLVKAVRGRAEIDERDLRVRQEEVDELFPNSLRDDGGQGDDILSRLL